MAEDLSERYIASVLGEANEHKPSHEKILQKVKYTQQLLEGWDTADLLRLLDSYLWSEEQAVAAALDGKFTKGEDWTEKGGKKKQAKPPAKAAPKTTARGRGSGRGRGASRANDDTESPKQNQGQGRSRGTNNQNDPARSAGRGRGAQSGRGRGSQNASERTNQNNRGAAPNRVQSDNAKQTLSQPPQQQQPPAPENPEVPPQIQTTIIQQQITQTNSYDANGRIYNTVQTENVNVGISGGLQGEWALRARKKIQSTQQAPLQAPKQSPPQKSSQVPPQQPSHLSYGHQQHAHRQNAAPPRDLHVEVAHTQIENLQIGQDSHVEKAPQPEPHDVKEIQHHEAPLEEGISSEQIHESHEDHRDESKQIPTGSSDPVFLPGLPGVDTNSYQFRFEAFENEENEKDSNETDERNGTETAPLPSGSDNRAEKVNDLSNDSRPEQNPSASFEQAQKTQNMAQYSHPHYENMEDTGISPQMYFPYPQQLPHIFLQQPSHLQNRQDPTMKVPSNVDPAVLPHIHQSHLPSPFFSGYYTGSPHHLLGDQGQFPYNPLPSDPAISDMRVRMFGLEPPPLPFPFHPQHQGQIGHGAQQVESSQNNIRNSPPINGPNQFVNSNSNSNPNDNAKFGQSQQMPHEMGNIHVSAGMGSHAHEMQGPQPTPQLGHQHHQPFPPYFFPSYIPGQFPIPMHAVRTPQYYGAHKGHPSPAYPQTMIDLHSPHGGHQPSFFPPEGKQQKHNVQVLYGHPSDSQDNPFDKNQQQASSQSSQQQQGHLQGDMTKGQAGPYPALSPGYNFNPHLHPYPGQPQN
jgi:hypothetical protein